MKLFRGKTLAVVAVVAGAVAASVVPGMADVSDQSPSNAAVLVESKAKFLAMGAAIEVKLTYTCPAGDVPPSGNVDVTQSVLGGITKGHLFISPPDCTGEQQAHTVHLVADDKPFRLGKAFVVGSIFSMNSSYSAYDEHEITIVP